MILCCLMSLTVDVVCPPPCRSTSHSPEARVFELSTKLWACELSHSRFEGLCDSSNIEVLLLRLCLKLNASRDMYQETLESPLQNGSFQSGWA